MRRLGVRIGLGILPAALLMGGASWGEGSGRCHTVRSGDTLSAIGHRYRVPLAKLRKLNAARLLRPLRVGTRLDVHPRATRAPAGRFGEGKGRMLRARPGQLRRENVAATRDRLTRMRDLDTVHRFRRAGLLVPVPAQTRTYAVVGVRAALRVARPWTRRFIEQLGA
jgi:hypothetical protein